MPNRILRDSIRTSHSLSLLTAEEERHFYRLLVAADDYGRFDARPGVIRGACYALHGDAISLENIVAWTGRLADMEIGIITCYSVDGKPYGQFVHWAKYQRPARAKESRYPPPPVDVVLPLPTCTTDHVQTLSTYVTYAPVVGVGVGVGVGIGTHEDVGAAAMKKPSPPSSPVPPDFRKLTELPGYRARNHTRAFKAVEAGCAAAGVSVAAVVAVYVPYYLAHYMRFGWKEPVRPLVNNLHREIAKVLRTGKGGVNAKFGPDTVVYEKAAAAQRERQRRKAESHPVPKV